jgi:hypothetical protein
MGSLFQRASMMLKRLKVSVLINKEESWSRDVDSGVHPAAAALVNNNENNKGPPRKALSPLGFFSRPLQKNNEKQWIGSFDTHRAGSSMNAEPRAQKNPARVGRPGVVHSFGYCRSDR